MVDCWDEGQNKLVLMHEFGLHQWKMRIIQNPPLKKFLLFQVFSFVSWTIQQGENYSILSVALCGRRTEGGWLCAWQSIESLFMKHQLLLCQIYISFIILFLFYCSCFFPPFIHSVFLSVGKSGSWSYLWAAESTPSLLTVDELRIVQTKLINSVIQSQYRWLPVTEHFSNADIDWFWNFPKRFCCKSINYLRIKQDIQGQELQWT